jgi:hypothetical protein
MAKIELEGPFYELRLYAILGFAPRRNAILGQEYGTTPSCETHSLYVGILRDQGA